MLNSAQATRLRTTIFPRIVDANKTIVAVSYVAAYVALDWVSFVEPYAAFNITPWNPNTGLSFIFILVFGLRMIPLVFVSRFLADLINQEIVVPWTVEILSVILIASVYSAALFFLKRSTTRFDPALSMRDLVMLILVAAASAALVASGYVGLRNAAGLLPAKDFMSATLRYWIGDVIGILGLAPLALIALTRPRILPMSIETALQCAAIVVALVIVFGFAEEREFQLFYVLFLPIIWMAVRNGTEGAGVGILITQLGVVLGVGLFPGERQELIAFQALMLVLAVTGLIAGELVTERRRAEVQLGLHRESLARLTRLGSVGELAAVTAHEVNQPLMAAGVYMRLVRDTIGLGSADAAEITETAKKAIAQIDRASEVIRRVRALVRLDRSNRTSLAFERIVKQVIELCEPDLERAGITTRFRSTVALPPVTVDILQVEQVLINLVRNSIEAISGSGSRHGSVVIEAKPTSDEFIEVQLFDSGPGFPREHVENEFLPLSSTKPEGLGVGLPICRSIVEAHGGRLWLDESPHGTSVRFTLPTAMKPAHG